MTRGGAPVRVHRIAGVYRPSDDTRLLLETLSERARGARVRELHHRTAPLGPVSRARFDHLVQLGVLAGAAPVDHLVVLEARKERLAHPGPVG